MIAFLEGTVAAKGAGKAIVKVGGVGYELLMSTTSLAMLPQLGEEVHVLTYLNVSDQGVSLFGFMDEEEQRLFSALTAVSGIGPKMSLAALSTFTPDELKGAVAAEDVKAISKIPGVGKKTASRIVLELKGSIPDLEAAALKAGAKTASSAMKNAVSALSSLGFTRKEIDEALEGAPVDGDEETLLQYALKRIG